MDTDRRYPLYWPTDWPRTKAGSRNPGQFKVGTSRGALTFHRAITRINDELGRFTKAGRIYRVQPGSIIISTNLRVRLDGGVISKQRMPDDPGAAAYFELDGKAQAIPCDRYMLVEQNLAAIAAAIEALRALERHGSGIMERAFRGFEALPHLPTEDWWVVFGFESPDVPYMAVKSAYKTLRGRAYNRDGQGHDGAFIRIQEAWQRYEAEVATK